MASSERRFLAPGPDTEWPGPGPGRPGNTIMILTSHWSILSILASNWSMLLILASDWSMLLILTSDWPGVRERRPGSRAAGPEPSVVQGSPITPRSGAGTNRQCLCSNPCHCRSSVMGAPLSSDSASVSGLGLAGARLDTAPR